VSAANTPNAAGGDVSVPGHDEARQTPIIPEMRRQLEPLPAGQAPDSGHGDGTRPTTGTPSIGEMGHAEGAGPVVDRVVGEGAGGLVSRPGLFDRLAEAARVTVVAAPAGSGKTVLLRSWMSTAGLADRTAWVTVGLEERDPQRFWISVIGALRRTVPARELVRELTAAPDLDGWAIVERLLKDLAPLRGRVWLVLDDVHELGADLALRQLELLVLRGPPGLRFVLATRNDLRLGLHRLRLEGELTELRADELRFTVDEARQLLAAAGVEVSGPALGLLVERAEGWAAGLRLAALSLAGHPDPERLAARFSGSERTVAEYLLAEVLDRQSEQVRRLLLRTSVLERVSGELADALTGGSGGERILQDLEEANAFVVSLDSGRSWFRYHRLLAGLLQLQLRRTAPDEVMPLHELAAHWFADHGFPVEAVRHAQAAQDWDLAVRLLADAWPGLHLEGQAGTIHELLAGFPEEARAADAALAGLTAVDELAQGSLEAAGQYLARAALGSASVPADRRGQLQVLLGMAGLLLARQRGNLPAVVEEARRLQAAAEAPDPAQFDLGEDLRALALINLGITELWAARLGEAERHLERGVTLARRIGRPFLELNGLANLTTMEASRSFPRAAERGRHAVELARRHGWTDEPAATTVYMVLGATLAWQGQFEEAESWVGRAERTVRAEAVPATGAMVRFARGLLELARGRCQEALGAFRAAERLGGVLTEAELIMRQTRALLLQALVRLGDTASAEQVLAGLEEQDREHGETRVAAAALRLALDEAPAATAELAPVLDGSASVDWPGWVAEAFLLEAMARDALGDPAAAGRALERALDLAEPDGLLSVFLLHPAPSLLERYAPHLTAHASLLAEIRSLLVGEVPAPPATGPRPLLDPVSKSELRVLRYLPTHLTAQDIAGELYVSANTVKTHMRTLYAKLGAHSRAEAVDRARAHGLLAASFRKP
jgi:LuxR family maltose regulon positive regulatory protein